MDKKLNQLKRFRLLTPAKEGGFLDSVISARQDNGLHTKHLLNERVVYSFLAYRSRHQSGASVREIVRDTTLHKQTVKRALNSLPLLVHQHSGEWYSNEPPDGWFQPRKYDSAEHWSDRLSYVMLLVPRKKATVNGHRFGLTHAAVFSYILSYTKKTSSTTALSINFLSTLLQGLNRKTIAAILHDLTRSGMIRCSQCGARLEIERLPLSDAHLELFERQQPRPGKVSVPRNSPISTKYVFRGDRFDDYRKICEPLMPQSYAERAISAARYFGWDIHEFEANLHDEKRRSDGNVRAGKCKVENFGKFFVMPLEERLKANEEARRKEEAERRWLEYQASPEGKKAQAEKQKAIAADPLHPDHIVDDASVIQRVRFADAPVKSRNLAHKTIMKVARHCGSFANAKYADTQRQVDEGGNLRHRVLSLALSKLNHHYQQDTFATPEQFEAAIDEAILEVEPAMEPLFGTGEA